MAHAKLQPSSAYRWLNCPGSIELSEKIDDPGSVYADEGTAGHDLFARVLAGYVGRDLIGKKAENGLTFTKEMYDLVEPCVEYVRDYAKSVRGAVFSEQKFEIGQGYGIKPGIFWGTADVVVMSSQELMIGDLKLGFQDVDVEDNEQIINYALGVLDASGWIHDSIRLVILQPKTKPEPKEFVYTAAQMEGFRAKFNDGVHTAAGGSNTLNATAKGCRFCKAAGGCPELRRHTLELAQRDFATETSVELVAKAVGALDGEQIAELLNKSELIKNALSAVETHALRMLEADPNSIPGYKRVLGEKKRAWRDEAQALQSFEALLDLDTVAPRKLTTPAQIEKALAAVGTGKVKDRNAAAKKMVSEFAYKPEGFPKLARDDDERAALTAAFTAEDVEQGDLIE